MYILFCSWILFHLMSWSRVWSNLTLQSPQWSDAVCSIFLLLLFCVFCFCLSFTNVFATLYCHLFLIELYWSCWKWMKLIFPMPGKTEKKSQTRFLFRFCSLSVTLLICLFIYKSILLLSNILCLWDNKKDLKLKDQNIQWNVFFFVAKLTKDCGCFYSTS